jgi:serine/threonine-protein kinase
MSLTVVLADDAALLRAGVATVLRGAGCDVVAEVGDAAGLLEIVDRTRPDLAVLDIRMPPTHTTEGIDAAVAIRRRFPGTRVLLLSQYVESAHAMELLEGNLGPVGYLLKERVVDVDEFLDAVRRIAAGETVIDPVLVQQFLRRPHRGHRPQDDLTDREREVLALMAEGHSNRAIGALLHLTERTVEAHIGAIFQKLGLAPEPDTNRRVLAVLAHLRETPV